MPRAALNPLRQRAQTLLGGVLPPAVSLPLRARFGGSREDELQVLAGLVGADDLVVDVGAHLGVYVYHLARLVGRGGRVIAYEPQPAMARYLRAATARGPLRDRVELRERALSDAPGTAVLSVPLVEGRSVIGEATLRHVDADVESITVPVAVLDDETFPGRVSFMKIDVEGHELALLRGGRGLLARDHPTLLVEVESRHAGEAVADLATLLLDDLGYRARELVDGALRPVDRSRWTPAALNRGPGGRYTNNFVFSV